jgi:hypothetical protein
VRPAVEQALASVARRLHAARIPFALGGSGLLEAHGLIEGVRDLDLMLPPGTLTALCEAVEDGWWQGVDREPHPVYASDYRARLAVVGVEVDALGGMALRVDDRVCPLPFATDGETSAAGETIPLAPLAQWWLVYRAARPERAALVEPALSPAARRQALELIGAD